MNISELCIRRPVFATVLSLLVVLSFLSPWMLGLIVVGPWLGHASWHAYRGAVAWRQQG